MERPLKEEQLKKQLLPYTKNLSKFRPDLNNHFMCPVCLKVKDLEISLKEITKAHIFPQYARGTLATFLCKKCNSDFGSKQDKWFGDFLHLKANNMHPLQSEKKIGYFEVDGVKVNGQFIIPDDGPIEFIIDQRRNSPVVFDKVISDISHTSNKIEFSIKSLIHDNSGLVSIGFLTAAYLYWFRKLGYSWVFQSHMDKVRQQILEPEKKIISTSFLLHTSGVPFDSPWIGAIDILDDSAAVMGIYNYLVVFPPASNRILYEELLNRINEVGVSYERFIDDGKLPVNPIGLAYRNSLLVFPDCFKDSEMDPVVIYFPGDGQPHQLMRKISREQRDEMKTQKNTTGIEVFFK